MMGGQGGMIADWIKSGADDTKRDQLTLYNMYEANRRENTRHSEWNTAMNFQTDAYYNRYGNAVADLKRAGLNPMLAMMQSPPGSGGSVGSSPASGTVQNDYGSRISFAGAAASAAQASLASSQSDLLKAQADRERAVADETRARTPSHAVSRDQMNQQIKESIERAKMLEAQTSRETASAQELISRVAVQKETLTQIRATVQNLISQSDKARAETGEINQRVKANLPQLTRALGDLDVAIKNLSIPGHENNRNAQESAAGAVGAAIRAIMPFRDLFN